MRGLLNISITWTHYALRIFKKNYTTRKYNSNIALNGKQIIVYSTISNVIEKTSKIFQNHGFCRVESFVYFRVNCA